MGEKERREGRSSTRKDAYTYKNGRDAMKRERNGEPSWIFGELTTSNVSRKKGWAGQHGDKWLLKKNTRVSAIWGCSFGFFSRPSLVGANCSDLRL